MNNYQFSLSVGFQFIDSASQGSKTSRKKIPEKFQEKTLNSLHTGNYLYSICTIFTTTYIALTWYYML